MSNPVFYQTKFDRRVYRIVMGLSAAGIAIAFGSIYAMATNRVPKK